MKLFKKTILVGTMCMSLLFALTACGDDKGDADTTAATTTEATTAAITTEATTEATTTATTEEAVVSVDLFADSGLPTFELSSEDLHDGAWDPVIASVDDGKNVSPQLSWEPVPEATCYVIYMVDTSAGNWMHWKVNGVTETNIPQGYSSSEEYIGPYPPGGTHSYDVYVFALRQPVEVARGPLNCRTNLFTKYALELDAVEEGSSGNIVSYGYLPGTYTRED